MSIKSSLRKLLADQNIPVDEDNASTSSLLRQYANALGETPEAGDSTDELLQKIVDSGKAGGNPNYVETITGTLANPWGSAEPATLYTELVSNAASILLTTSVGNDTVTLPIVADAAGILRRFKAVTAVDYNEGLQTYTAAYDDNGTLLVFVRATAFSDNGSIDNLISVASGVPTTLTIIHHPLPETSE